MCHKSFGSKWKISMLTVLCAISTLACSPDAFARGGGGGGGHGGGGFGGGRGFGGHGLGARAGRGFDRGFGGLGFYGWGGGYGWGDGYDTQLITAEPDHTYDQWLKSEDKRRQNLHREEVVHDYSWK